MQRRNFLGGLGGSILSGAVILTNPKLLQGQVIDKVIKPTTDLIVPEPIILSTDQDVNQLGFSGWMYVRSMSVSSHVDSIKMGSFDDAFFDTYAAGLRTMEITIKGTMDGLTFSGVNQLMGRNQKMYISI